MRHRLSMGQDHSLHDVPKATMSKATIDLKGSSQCAKGKVKGNITHLPHAIPGGVSLQVLGTHLLVQLGTSQLQQDNSSGQCSSFLPNLHSDDI